jgi:hypothetical protein
MKKITLLIGLCFPFIGKSQPANMNLNNSTCGYYSNSAMTLSGTTNTFVVGTGGDYLFKSVTSVHIPVGTHISTSTSATGKFNASICNNQLDAVILPPVDINHVPEFSKVEFGIDLATISSLGGTSIDNRISAFLSDATGNYKPGTIGYTTAFNAGTIINPYDPQQISVDAVLFKPLTNVNPVIRHGFYFKDVTSTSTDWTTAIAGREFRVRFAPDVQGLWTGYINIYIGNQLLIENKAISFNVEGPLIAMKSGFVQKGPKPQYLQYSGTGDTYIPVGNNYSWSQEQYYCATQNCLNTADHRMAHGVRSEFTNFINLLTDQPAGNGGNTTRLLMCPWGMQIEFEKLGNYDSRQIEMSELDAYIDLLEQKNVKLILGQLIADLHVKTDQNPAVYTEGWLANPYNGNISGQSTYPNYKFKGINGITTCADLYNPANSGYATALQFFKNRWRYIEARWGYSTAISSYELLTEADVMDENYWANGMETNVANWCNGISQYLKESEGSKHLTTVSYLGDNFLLSNNMHHAQVWNKPYIDMISGHTYMDRDATDRINFQNVKDAKSEYPSKPVMYNEMNPMEFDNITYCTDIALHNSTWASMFSGSVGPGLSWESRRYNIALWGPPFVNPAQPNQNYGDTTKYEGEYERNYPALLAYLYPIDFKTTTYSNYSSLQPTGTPYYEIFDMVNNTQERAFGWIHNRSFNKYKDYKSLNNTGTYPNMSDLRNAPENAWFKNNAPQTATANGGYFQDEDNYNDVFGTGFSPMGRSGDFVVISNLLINTPYDVEWYWTWGSKGGQNELLYAANNLTSSGSGGVSILVPPTGTVGGTLYPGDWAFKIIKHSLHKTATGIEELQQNHLQVSPNPSTNVFVISSPDGAHEKATLRLFDISGRLIHEETVQDVNGYQLNLQSNDNGIYILKVAMKGSETILKLIKNGE